MTLEDHPGDIVRKAREAAGLGIESVAQAAGLKANDLQALEQTGSLSGQVDWAALAKAVQLSPEKLTHIAKGWLPSAKDLSNWRELRMFSTSQNGITVNSYLAWDEVTREGAIFDTGWSAEALFQAIDENQVTPRHLFLTHMHDDHVAAMGAIREKFPKIHLHTSSAHAPPQHRNRANDFIHVGSLRITNRATPGHAEEGVIYVIGTWPEDASHVAIIGDTLFAGSMATGFQSVELLKQSVRQHIFSLPEDTLLCPGHGPLSTIAEEKRYNPFF